MLKKLSNFVVRNVTADVLAPVGARASTGIVMTELWIHIYTGPAFVVPEHP